MVRNMSSRCLVLLIKYCRPASLTALVKLFTESKHLKSAQFTETEDPDEMLRSLDFEEQGGGYQVAYSKLAASETVKEDPVAYVGDTKEFVGKELARAVKADPRINGLIASADPSVVSGVQSLINAARSA